MEFEHLLKESLQYILVAARDWDCVEGKMTLFGRESVESDWHAVQPPFDVVLGKKGLAWGRGLHSISPMENPVKKEGDLRAPAGVFRIGIAFGYDANENIRWPYLQLNDKMLAVDDPGSSYYNCIVAADRIEHRDWNSAEIMRREDGLYKWGLTIDHNMYPALPGEGSCIFMHIWRGAGMGTEGCTAMPEEKMKMLLEWLDPDANPLLVQFAEEN